MPSRWRNPGAGGDHGLDLHVTVPFPGSRNEWGPGDRIRALDVRDGSVHWTFSTPDGQPLYNVAVGDGAV